MSTTIQVSETTAKALKKIYPYASYEQAIKQLMGVRKMQGKSQIMTFKRTLAALQEDSQEQRVSAPGTLTSVIMDFPSGCEFLVYVRLCLMRGNHKDFIIPSIDNQYIIMDDANPHFNVTYPVEEGDRLRTEWQNYDGLNPHTVVVTATIMPRIPLGD